MKKAWNWIKDNVAAVAGFIAIALAFILYRKWKADQVNSLKDALVVSNAEKTIAVLEESKKAVDSRVAGREIEINEIDKNLEVNKRRIVEVRTGLEKLTADEILEEYKRLGYLE